MRFVIPLPPNRANARGSWRKHHRQRNDYFAGLDVIAALAHRPLIDKQWRMPPRPSEPMVKATASATLFVYSPMDEGNALNRLKWTEDWLVDRGYLVDDNRKVLRWAAIPEQIIDRKWPRVELTLEAA